MQNQLGSKQKILAAALHEIRSKGYAAATVDDVCNDAGVTKGSFFHHFKSKDDMALSAISFWNSATGGLFASAAYHQQADPLKRLLGYVEFRAEIIQGELADFTCLLGTLVQETYETHPQIRAACADGLASHITELTGDVEAAKAMYAPSATWTSESVGVYIQSVLQGSFIFAKATQRPEVVLENLDHLKRYLKSLFNENPTEGLMEKS